MPAIANKACQVIIDLTKGVLILVFKERVELRSDWDKREVTERQSYMQDLEEDIEISTYRMKVLGLGQLEQEFAMRQDSLEQTKLVIEFANSTRGRNHFKNNYIRHIRMRNNFEEVAEKALNLITEIKRELKYTNE